MTVQNPFTAFSTVQNATAACQYGVDRPNGDEPGMPLTMFVSDADTCSFICSSDPKCLAYAYINGGCHGADHPVCFLKATVTPTASVPNCMCSGLRTDPTHQYSLATSYSPRMTWSAYPPRSTGHLCDAAVIGVYNLTKYYVAETGINNGERDAFSDCVDAFLLDKSMRTRTVKINVAWVTPFS